MTPARERLTAVIAVVVLGAGAVLASTRPFASVGLPTGRTVTVAGSAVAPVLAPLGIVALALAAALAIAGGVARRLLGAVLVLLGVGVLGAALPAALHPAAGIGGAVTAATGVAGADALAALTARTAGTGWTWFAAADGVLLVLAGVVVLVRAGRWAGAGRRFRTAAPVRPESADPVEEWDALTAGADPTES